MPYWENQYYKQNETHGWETYIIPSKGREIVSSIYGRAILSRTYVHKTKHLWSIDFIDTLGSRNEMTLDQHWTKSIVF